MCNNWKILFYWSCSTFPVLFVLKRSLNTHHSVAVRSGNNCTSIHCTKVCRGQKSAPRSHRISEAQHNISPLAGLLRITWGLAAIVFNGVWGFFFVAVNSLIIHLKTSKCIIRPEKKRNYKSNYEQIPLIGILENSAMTWFFFSN